MNGARRWLGSAVTRALPTILSVNRFGGNCRPPPGRFLPPRFVDGGPLLAVLREELALRAAKMGCVPVHDVAITCFADSRPVQLRVKDGEAMCAVHAGAALTLSTDMMRPTLRGEANVRNNGIAIYSIPVTDASGVERELDLDDGAVVKSFHPGERESGLHYR